ncbi:MAG TPA: hypothetical protein GX708_12165 [Gallicola sp.]|nr:hypothetical protein [Gallicola sp.]
MLDLISIEDDENLQLDRERLLKLINKNENIFNEIHMEFLDEYGKEKIITNDEYYLIKKVFDYIKQNMQED